MNKQSNAIYTTIPQLFEVLSKDEQVSLMAELYYSMDAYHKDKFLEETENA